MKSSVPHSIQNNFISIRPSLDIDLNQLGLRSLDPERCRTVGAHLRLDRHQPMSGAKDDAGHGDD